MRQMQNYLSLILATVFFTGCGGGGTNVDTIAAEQKWLTLDMALHDVGVDYEPSFRDGKCHIYIALPTEQELHENILPTRTSTFYHIGNSIEQCLFAPAGTSSLQLIPSLGLIRDAPLLLDQAINIDYNPDPNECGENADRVLGCFVSWASLVVLNDSVIESSLTSEMPYDLLSRHIIGHEVWHLYAGPFHAGYY